MAVLRKILAVLICGFLLPMAALADEPLTPFSLVAVGAVSTTPSPQSACGDEAICDRVSWGGFEGAHTLAGPDLGAHFGATIVVHVPVHNEPMLVVIQAVGNGENRVVARGRWNSGTGQACIDRRELDALDFHPAGDGIIENAAGTCAKIVRLRDQFESALPVETISAEQIGKISALSRKSAVPPFTLATRSNDSGPIALAEIRLERGYPNGESWCPPDIDWETEICLGSSIVFAPGRVIRRLGASDDLDPQWNRRKFKYIGGHAIRWAEGGHWIAVIEQTDQDYWYVQWKAPIRNGRFCIHPSAAEFYGMTSGLDYTSGEDGSRCYSLRDAKRR